MSPRTSESQSRILVFGAGLNGERSQPGQEFPVTGATPPARNIDDDEVLTPYGIDWCSERRLGGE